MSAALWTPSAERAAGTALARFIAFAQKYGSAARPDAAPVKAYEELWRWSIEQRSAFWQAIWDFGQVRASRTADAVLEDGERMPGARWFRGARLNFAENLLREPDAALALIARDERGRRRSLTYAQLREAVAAVAAALKADGLTAGDRVAGFLPNSLEAVIAMLATTRLGAIWSSCSPDFGEGGVLDRFGQIEPKVLFACDGYFYAGKAIDTRERVARIARALPGLKRLVIVPFLNDAPDLGDLSHPTLFSQYRQSAEPDFAQLPFEHPLYILYSSGTTGKPKCIVHGAGGTLLQHLKELQLHTDVRPGDRLFFFTTCGWMMWNWLVSGLAAGATVVLYDGSPLHPGPEALWRMAEEERLTHFGISPKYLGALEKTGYRPVQEHRLPELRSLMSTGSPLAPEQFDFVYARIKDDLQLASISGGTDIISCFALGNPMLPVHRGELQCRGLGMAVDVFDERGRTLRGAPGELVCTRAFPSMPVGFWNDADGRRYRAAYFERFPGVWHHGDYAMIAESGGLVIQGRSDATLNPGGVRIGTAEIYRVVDALPEVLESVVVGHRDATDERVILFVRLREGQTLDRTLEQKIRMRVREELSPRHVPAKILPCPEVPRTISGKITELAVRSLLRGEDVKNRDALANPAALDYFKNLPREALY